VRRGRPRAHRPCAPGPRSRTPRGRRPALPPGDAAARGGGVPGDPRRHREVPAAPRAPCDARRRRASRGPGSGHRRAGRMTSEPRFERQLPAILEDLYLGPTPDYRDQVLATAVRTRQRPSWTFAGRWLPMADIAGRSAFVPRVPWRALGAALLVIALLLVAALAFVGSRHAKVPPPFGPAENGVVAYAANG